MNPSPSIALVGFYNIENAGDERLRFAFTRLLASRRLSVFSLETLTKGRLEDFDWVVIGGGSILHAHNPIFTQMPQNIFAPHQRIGVAGISASGQAVPDQVHFVRALAERSDFFFVRDSHTRAFVGSDLATLAPDVTWCTPFAPHPSVVEKCDVALALAPCPWKPDFKVEDWMSALTGLSLEPWPFYYHDNLDPGLIAPFFPAGLPMEFSIDPLLRSRVLLASRFHAIIFALQTRKPFVAIEYDAKVRHLLEDNDLGDLCFGVAEHQAARVRLDELLDNPHDTQRRLEGVAQRLEAEGTELARAIKCHISTAPPQAESRMSSLLRRVFDR